MVNRPVMIAVIGIGGIAFVNAVIAKKPVTRIVLAVYLLLLLLGILDAFGGLFSTLASAIAMLAFVTMLLTQTGNIWPALAKLSTASSNPVPSSTSQQSGNPGGNFK